MSMTKRMMESPPRRTETQRAADRKERNEAIKGVFSILKTYHIEYVRANNLSPISQVYKRLFANATRAPSQTKFYSDVKKAKGLPGYLTHYFYNHVESCLESLYLPSSKVRKLVEQTDDGIRWVLELEEAGKFAPSAAELESDVRMRPRARRFRHHPKHFPDILLAKSIYEFFNEVHRKKKAFYSANPDQLFNLEALDYKTDYLQSPYWFLIRNIVLFRDGFECGVCKKPATTVHHHYYSPDVLYGKDLNALVSLCDSCHKKIEFDDAGAKVTDIEEKRHRFEKLKLGS